MKRKLNIRALILYFINTKIFKTPEGQYGPKTVQIIQMILFPFWAFYEHFSKIKVNHMKQTITYQGIEVSMPLFEVMAKMEVKIISDTQYITENEANMLTPYSFAVNRARKQVLEEAEQYLNVTVSSDVKNCRTEIEVSLKVVQGK